MIAEAGRLGEVRQALVNPSDEALWNLLSACSNTGARPQGIQRRKSLAFRPRHHEAISQADGKADCLLAPSDAFLTLKMPQPLPKA